MASQPALPPLRAMVMALKLDGAHGLKALCRTLRLLYGGNKPSLQARVLALFGEPPPPGNAQAAVAAGNVARLHGLAEDAARAAVAACYCAAAGLPPPPPPPASNESAREHFGGPGPAAAAAAMAPLLPRSLPQAPWAAAAPAAAPPPPPALAAAGVVRCVCGTPHARGRLLRCGRCPAVQHAECLGPAAPPPGAAHLCELCRVALADPFWAAEAELFAPARLRPRPGAVVRDAAGRLTEVQAAEKAVYVPAATLAAARADPRTRRLALACVKVGDAPAARLHWPRHADVRVNTLPLRPYSRAAGAKMGANQRDEAVSLEPNCMAGRNTVVVSAADTGAWLLVGQVQRRRTDDEVRALMAPPEAPAAAAARVRLQLGGGAAGDVAVASQVVSLRDPMSGQRMGAPARFAGGASGLQAFDLDAFLSMVARHRKWQDPSTLRDSTVEALQLDGFMGAVLAALRAAGPAAAAAVDEVEVSAEGLWRPAGGAAAGGRWFSVEAPAAEAGAALAAAGLGAAGGGGGAAAGGAAAVGDSDDESEGAELRRAAAAAAAPRPPGAGAKRRREEAEAGPEVVDLVSSDDEGASPLPLRQRLAPAVAAAGLTSPRAQALAAAAAAHFEQRPGSPASPPGPLSIRLPPRGAAAPPPRPAAAPRPAAPPLPQWLQGQQQLQALQQQQVQQFNQQQLAAAAAAAADAQRRRLEQEIAAAAVERRRLEQYRQFAAGQQQQQQQQQQVYAAAAPAPAPPPAAPPPPGAGPPSQRAAAAAAEIEHIHRLIASNPAAAGEFTVDALLR